MIINGGLMGWAPAHVKRIKILMNIQYINWFIGKKDREGMVIFCRGKVYKIKIDINRAITPPSLLGMDRRMAYAKRKYHSGWIWIGVIIGLAGVKLSGSLNM